MGATVGVCARVEGCVCVWILYAHKKKKKKDLGWIRSCTCGNTFSRNSFHEIHNEAGLSSDVAPLLASHRLQLVCVCVRPCFERIEKEPLHLTLLSSLHFILLKKKIPPKTTNWLWWAPRWAQSFRRIRGPLPLVFPPFSSQWFSPAMALLS